MTTQVQPPPTWALPIIVDETSQEATFNPVWLNWFLLLGKAVSDTTAPVNSLLVLSVAGSSNVVLTSGQGASSIIEFTGVLTGNITVTTPAVIGPWTMYNNTTGNYTLTVKGPTGAGIVLTQTFRGIFYYDGIALARSDGSAVS
jgi:hypothetical protein